MNQKNRCQGCKDTTPLPFEISMAFQPIVDLGTQAVWGYEALVRGDGGLGAEAVLSMINDSNRYRFDQACRVKAIEAAAALLPAGGTERLSINFMPNAVYEPTACIRATLDACKRTGLEPHRLNFEFTENETMLDTAHVQNILSVYKQLGFTVALDDFGAGYAGLNLLADFQPDLIKLDMALIRGIDESRVRQAIVSCVVSLAATLGITVIAEGVETAAEASQLKEAGINLFQGFLFAKPDLARLPAVLFPVLTESRHGYKGVA